MLSKIKINENYQQILKFLITGVFGNILNYLIFFFFFKTLNFNYLIAGIIGFLSPNPVLFIINRNWTFKSNTGYNKMYLMFIISGICLCLHIVAQYFAHELLHVPKIFSQLFGQASAAVLNFLFLKFYLFKK